MFGGRGMWSWFPDIAACCCFFLTIKRKIESMVYFIYFLAFIGVCICMFVEIKKY